MKKKNRTASLGKGNSIFPFLSIFPIYIHIQLRRKFFNVLE